MTEYVLEVLDDMFTAGCDIKREQIRREHPTATEGEIEEMLRAWLAQRPGAEHGDAAGRPCTVPRG